MTPWWKNDPRRLAIELQLLRRATNARVLRQGNTLLFDEDIAVGGKHFGLRCVFPDDFPYSYPRIYLRYPELPNLAEIHRFRDGALCLHGYDDWVPTRTSLWLRNRAVAWCTALERYSRTGAWEHITH